MAPVPSYQSVTMDVDGGQHAGPSSSRARGRVLGFDTSRARSRSRRRRTPKRVKRFNKRVRKVVLNTSELKRCRIPPSYEVGAVDMRSRSYDGWLSQGCVLIPVFDKKPGSDDLMPTNQGTSVQKRIGDEIFSEYVRINLHIRHPNNANPITFGSAGPPIVEPDLREPGINWYIGWKII